MPRTARILPALLLTAFALAAPGAADELSDATAAFHSAIAKGDADGRRDALAELVGLADDGALPALLGEMGRVSDKLRRERDEAYKGRYRLERKRQLLERLKLQAERDPTLQESLQRQREETEELAGKLEKSEAAVRDLDPWLLALGEGTRALFASISDGKRRKALDELWTTVQEGAEAGTRLAAVEVLGYVGADGTALEMQDLVVGLSKERAQLKRKLPKLLGEVRKLEERMQREQEQLEGKMSKAMAAQYDRVRKEASDLQREISMRAYLVDAAVEAGGRALARESGKVLEKSLAKLLRGQAKAKDGARQRTIELIGRARTEATRAALRGLLAEESEPVAVAALIDALASSGDAEVVPELIERRLASESWHVKSRAAAALARLRSREAIPAMIERMASESGRTKTDLREALVSLTGLDFHTNVELWRRWWKENEADFVVPPVAELEARASEEAKAAVGVTFFGIETESEAVLFVLDLSGSMNFSMVPRDNPEDQDPNRPDMPKEGEISRLTAAKRALTTAVGGISEGSTFELICYASDVWMWQERLVEMDVESRAEALAYVDELEAVGGTNIYGALQTALELAGAEGGSTWKEPAIDTIYFLSDGRPSVGVSTDPDEILAMVRDRNASAGIVIHTIGLSGAQDAYLLRSLAEQNGGTYVAR